MENILPILLVIVMLAAFAGFFFYQRKSSKELEDKLLETAKKLNKKETAEEDAEDIVKDAKRKAADIVEEAEAKAASINKKLAESEKALEEREKKQLEMSKSIAERMEEIEKKEEAVEQAKRDVRKNKEKVKDELEKVAKMTRKEAREQLLEELEKDLKTRISKRIHEAKQKAKQEAEDKAKDILVDAMQRSATDFVAETTSTTFQIADEDLKGKIIGKEGRNIRAFERLTGVDIIVDEAPDLVTVSSFDPIRREVAAIAIKKLLKDGRVHPGSIEETVKNIKNDLAREIVKTGEKIAYDTGFPDLPDEVIKLLGRFKYRFSYGQNLVKHSLEMVNLGQQLAQEIGADVELTKKACLLHDLGKVLTYEIEGKPHHHISGDIVRKYLKDEKLANAVESHHGDIEPESIEAILVQIADAISGARPGARRDSYDKYIQRVKSLEDIAKQYNSVKEAYAINAGREVRVIVKPREIDDEDSEMLAHRIAKEIEEKENYPGTVKITVIREMRIEAEAK
jgi:ribonuclease Y